MDVKEKYKNYLKTKTGINQYNCFKSIIYTQNDTLVESICNIIISELENIDAISICDIGGGDGERIMKIIKYLNKHLKCTVNLDFIEQSELMCAIFKKSVPNKLIDCKINILPKEIECVKIENTYDLIFFIHSIFCLHDFKIFKRVFEHLNQNGLILVASNSHNSFIASLKEKLDVEYFGKRYEIQDLIFDLKANNVFYREIIINTSFMLGANEFNEKFSVILEWLSLGRFHNYDAYEKKRILNFAKERAKLNNDIYHIEEKEKILIIPKNSLAI